MIFNSVCYFIFCCDIVLVIFSFFCISLKIKTINWSWGSHAGLGHRNCASCIIWWESPLERLVIRKASIGTKPQVLLNLRIHPTSEKPNPDASRGHTSTATNGDIPMNGNGAAVPSVVTALWAIAKGWPQRPSILLGPRLKFHQTCTKS